VEAMNYFSYAASYDANLQEANQRLALLAKQIESGNIGENIRNDIQLRNAWKKLLEDAIAFYDEHPYVNLVYRTVPETGQIDYNKNTAELVFSFWLEPNAGVYVIKKILDALAATKKTNEWGLQDLARQLYHSDRDINTPYYTLEVYAELFDENMVFLAKTAENYSLRWLTGIVNLDTLRDPFTGAEKIEHFGQFSYIAFSSRQNNNPKLKFSVDAKISDSLIISFPTVRKVYYGSGRNVNAADNILIVPTEKTFADYFSKRPQYRNVQKPPEYTSYKDYYEYYFPSR